MYKPITCAQFPPTSRFKGLVHPKMKIMSVFTHVQHLDLKG